MRKRTFRMRRLLVFVPLLIAGAIINIAVAWGCAIRWQSDSDIGLTDRSYWEDYGAHNELAVGLPVRSLEGYRHVDIFGNNEIRGLWIIERWSPHREYLLPYKPMPGFAINTIFYAVTLWSLFVSPFTLRRWRRSKRGLCPKCAYPIGTNDTCTECGRPVRHSRAGHPSCLRRQASRGCEDGARE